MRDRRLDRRTARAPYERWTNWDSLMVAAIVLGGGAVCMAVVTVVELFYKGG